MVHQETIFEGLPISGGVALARVCLFNDRRHDDSPVYQVAHDEIAAEKARLQQSLLSAAENLDKHAAQVRDKVGDAQAEIFLVQKMMIEDPTLQSQMFEHIEREKTNAEAVVSMSLDAYELALSQVDNSYMQERVSDVAEAKRRILDALRNTKPALSCSGQAHCQQGQNRIIVAEELTPSLTTELDTEQTLGFVTEHGGVGSHAAILARALDIPAVSGIKNIHSLLTCGTEVLLDGDAGKIIVWPSSETLKQYPQARRAVVSEHVSSSPIPGLKVLANISRAAEVGKALEVNAEGIGLYRTEFEFLAAGRLLDEEEQYRNYAQIVKAMDGRPVTFRLLDFGGDKAAPFLGLPREENPYLGFRGSRLLLGRPELLDTQARALARAAGHGPVHVLYPMIIDKEQFITLRDRFLGALEGQPDHLSHGAMFEVPSACLQSREILEVADFASIGTNDLIQYLFAVDRNNELVAFDYSPDRPVFWSVIASVIEAAAATSKPLSVCGELAANPVYLLKLKELGIESVSVSPRQIPFVRSTIHEVHAPG